MARNAPDTWPTERAAVLRDAVGVGLAVGALGLSFGALSVIAGLSLLQTCALSVLMFSGASQFAVIGVAGVGAGPLAGAAAAALLGIRNGLYGLHLGPLLRVRGLRRAVAAHLVLDESSAMSLGRASERAARLGFWATGISVFTFWNLATVAGALGAQVLPDPTTLGLDVAAPAAFVALLAPRLRSRQPWAVALAAVVVALAAVPFTPAGVPVLLAALPAVAVGLRARRGGTPDRSRTTVE
jgi:predicted branched-subunit amino acid permease